MSAVQWSAQREFNKRHMKIVDMMDTVISTGYKYYVGSVDPEELQQTGQNRLIGIDPDNAPEGMNSVQQLESNPVNESLFRYQEILDKLTLTLGNVTEASLGMDEKRNTLVSGRLAQVQIAQNLLTNRKVFDNIDQSQQVLGTLVLKAIQRNYPPGKIKRMLGEEPTEQFYDGSFEHFDTVVKEGVRSKSQRDAYYYELVNLKREGIVDVPQSEIVRALSMTGITDLREAIDAQQQQQAEQQAKIDEQERLAMELANSQKIANLSLSKEREARVLADIGLAKERESEASSNLADAALARAKTITEIADMETDRLMKVLAFVNTLHDAEKDDQAAVAQDTERLAATIDQIQEVRQAQPIASSQQQEQEAPQF